MARSAKKSSRKPAKSSRKKKQAIYCGNNRHAEELRNGAVIGTRYKCMQKGIGRALHMAPDPKFLGRYAAISENKMWCGDSQAPRGKVNGTNPQCLTKGFGIGAKINAERNLGRGRRRGRPVMGFGDDLDQLEAELVEALAIVRGESTRPAEGTQIMET